MNKTIEVLMKRDKLSEEEATELFNKTRDKIHNETDFSYFEVEDILMDDLGIEMDYIFDFL